MYDYRHVLDALKFAIVVVDSSYLITFANDTARNCSRRSKEFLVGESLFLSFPGLPFCGANLDVTFKSGQSQIYKHSPINMLGHIRLYDIDISPARDSQNSLLVITIEDVTDVLKDEGMMIHAEKMHSLGGLAVGIAHELNNPLSAIVQSVQVLESRLYGNNKQNTRTAQELGVSLSALQNYLNSREIISLIKFIQGSAVRASKIITSMLEFCRNNHTDMTRSSLSEILDNALGVCRSECCSRGQRHFSSVNIIHDYDGKIPLIFCSVNMLQQVFVNIIQNALQAIFSSNTQIKIPQIVLRTCLDGNFARIEIEDNGPGMEEYISKHVFEPFFTTKKPGQGTGLGLSVSYFIVTSVHEGTIDVKSVPGVGTVFIVKIPLNQHPKRDNL